MSTSDLPRDLHAVAVIGLGGMGAALARAFAAAGHETAVWNRTRSKVDELVEAGAHGYGSAAEAVASSRTTVICVSDYDTVKAILGDIDDFGGRSLINLTSGTSADADKLAEWSAARGARYLDGAILDEPSAIGADGASTVLYSGDRSSFQDDEGLLKALGSGATFLGTDPKQASLFDTVALTMGWSVLNGYLQSAALLRARGIDPQEAVATMVETTTMVAGWIPRYAAQLEDEQYDVLDSSIAGYHAAMGNVVREGDAAGVDVSIPSAWRSLAGRAVVAGDGDLGYGGMIEHFRRDGAGRGH